MKSLLKRVHIQETSFGFEFGAASITRICSDAKAGWVLMLLRTPKRELEIYVTKTGKIRVLDASGEWVPPKMKMGGK